MNITIEALESYLSDRYGGRSIVKSSPVVSTRKKHAEKRAFFNEINPLRDL